MHDVVKDSIFLKSFTKNDQKLMKAGEYRTQFSNEFQILKNINHLSLIPSELLEPILNIIHTIEHKKLFRGKGGEIMRISICRLIESFSIAEIPLNE